MREIWSRVILFWYGVPLSQAEIEDGVRKAMGGQWRKYDLSRGIAFVCGKIYVGSNITPYWFRGRRSITWHQMNALVRNGRAVVVPSKFLNIDHLCA